MKNNIKSLFLATKLGVVFNTAIDSQNSIIYKKTKIYSLHIQNK